MTVPLHALLCSLLHLDVRLLVEVLEQVAALKVFVRVHNGLELCRSEDALVFCLFEFLLVQVLEHARDVLVREWSG